MSNFNYSNDTNRFLNELHESFTGLRDKEHIEQLYFHVRREFNASIVNEQLVDRATAESWVQQKAINAFTQDQETGEVIQYADYEYGDDTFNVDRLKFNRGSWYTDIYGNVLKFEDSISSFIVTNNHGRGYFAPGMRSRVAFLMGEISSDDTFNSLVDQISRYLNTQLKTYYPRKGEM